MEHAQEEAAVLGGARLLDVKLREGHEIAVGDPDQQAAGVQRADVGCGHHDHIGDDAEEASHPQAHAAAQLGGGHAGGAGAEEGPEGHERRDELLAGGGDVPPVGDRRISVAVDLGERNFC